MSLRTGALWEVDNETRDPRSKEPVDPATLQVTVRKPDGTDIPVTPVKTGVGLYTARSRVTEHGTWHMTWTSPEGVYIAVDTISEDVKDAPSP